MNRINRFATFVVGLVYIVVGFDLAKLAHNMDSWFWPACGLVVYIIVGAGFVNYMYEKIIAEENRALFITYQKSIILGHISWYWYVFGVIGASITTLSLRDISDDPSGFNAIMGFLVLICSYVVHEILILLFYRRNSRIDRGGMEDPA